MDINEDGEGLTHGGGITVQDVSVGMRRVIGKGGGSRTWRLCAFRQGPTTRRSRATPRRRDAGSTAQPPCAHHHVGA